MVKEKGCGIAALFLLVVRDLVCVAFVIIDFEWPLLVNILINIDDDRHCMRCQAVDMISKNAAPCV